MAQIPHMRVETLLLCDDKYELVRAGGSLHCLRHGEPWRNLTGDKMVGAMFDELLELRKACAELQAREESRATRAREQGDGWGRA